MRIILVLNNFNLRGRLLYFTFPTALRSHSKICAGYGLSPTLPVKLKSPPFVPVFRVIGNLFTINESGGGGGEYSHVQTVSNGNS